MSEHERAQTPGYVHFLAVFDSSLKAGKPVVRPFTEAVDQQGHMWEATKSAGALSIIDVPTFVELSHFYNDNSTMYASRLVYRPGLSRMAGLSDVVAR